SEILTDAGPAGTPQASRPASAPSSSRHSPPRRRSAGALLARRWSRSPSGGGATVNQLPARRHHDRSRSEPAMLVQEVRTDLEPHDVIRLAREFFSTRFTPYAAFVEDESDTHIALRLEAGELVIGTGRE